MGPMSWSPRLNSRFLWRPGSRFPPLNLHGTGLDGKGLPSKPLEVITGEMWLKAVRTLDRLAELGSEKA
jgi:hypothetical protein